MSGNWLVDVAIALIGALGLIVPGYLTYKGTRLGRDKEPPTEQHGTLAWESSRTRDFLAREHEETRRHLAHAQEETCRQLREVEREILRAIREGDTAVQWAMLAKLAKLQGQE